MKEANPNSTYILLRDVPTMDWDDEGTEILPAGLELINLKRTENKNFRNHIWYYCTDKKTQKKYSIRYVYANCLAEVNEENLQKIREFQFAQIDYFESMNKMNKSLIEIKTLD